MKTNASYFRPLVGAVVVVLLGLTVIAGGAEAKGGKGDGGGGGGGGSNNYNTVIHDLARLNEALQGDVVGFGPRGGDGSDSYEGHPPPWLNLHTPSQRDAYCRAKHPSYNAATGRYTTYSGRQRLCVAP